MIPRHCAMSRAIWLPQQVRRPGDRPQRLAGQPLPDRRALHGPVGGRIQPRHLLGRGAGGAEQAGPEARHQLGVAGLLEGRHLGEERRPLGEGQAEQAQLAGADVLQGGGRRLEADLDHAGQQVGGGRAAAAVDDVHQVDAHGLRHQHAEEVADAADAVGRVAQRVGAGLGVGDEAGDVARRQGGVDRERERAVEQQRDRREVLELVGQARPQQHVQRQAGGAADQHRQPVLRRARHRLGGDDGVAARAVVHDDGLAQGLRHVLRHHAGDDVGQPAGRERHHEADGGRGLGAQRRRERQPGRGSQQQAPGHRGHGRSSSQLRRQHLPRTDRSVNGMFGLGSGPRRELMSRPDRPVSLLKPREERHGQQATSSGNGPRQAPGWTPSCSRVPSPSSVPPRTPRRSAGGRSRCCAASASPAPSIR